MSLKAYTGYHGTTLQAAEIILKTNFKVNYEHQGWLGTGVYFFDDNLYRAKDYAKSAFKNKKQAVIKCEFSIPEEKIFDTTIPKNAQEFHRFRETLIKDHLRRGNKDIRSPNRSHFDGLVYNMISKQKGATLIRANTFTKPSFERLDNINTPNSLVPNGVELCLKSPNLVNNKSKVYISSEEG